MLQIFPRMLLNPNLFVLFNLFSKKEAVTAVLIEKLQSNRLKGLMGRILFLANPPLSIAKLDPTQGACNVERQELEILRAAGMPVVDVRALILPYLAEQAAGRLQNSDGPPSFSLTQDHWGVPLLRVVVRYILTRVASVRYALGIMLQLPTQFSCNNITT